jgi:hypothetical protein
MKMFDPRREAQDGMMSEVRDRVIANRLTLGHQYKLCCEVG